MSRCFWVVPPKLTGVYGQARHNDGGNCRDSYALDFAAADPACPGGYAQLPVLAAMS
jgi:hypothetical protein